jgi:hypothetical protein
MSFLEKARQTAAESLNQLTGAEGKSEVREAAGQVGASVRELAGQARRGVVTVIERIDPDILADLIIKATALQEKANRALSRKGSTYRIGELNITATIPPQIGFSISRIGDVEEVVAPGDLLLASSELESAVATADEAVLSLEGDTVPAEGT